MNLFAENEYLIRKKILQFFGGSFHIYDKNNKVVAYTKMKAFKLKEDIKMYTDENMNVEILSIQARNVLDISATYDVYQSSDKKKLGALRRKGFKSLIRDEWLILDENDNEIANIKEDSAFKAILRRFINLIPQTYFCTMNNRVILEFKQNFNPFVMKINVIFKDREGKLNRLLGMAAGLLLCAIEGKQRS